MGIFKAGRGGPTKQQYAARGLLLLAGIGGLLMVLMLSMSGAFADTSKVSASLDSAGGAIVPGSDVKMSGLVVGSVATVSGDQDGVKLDLNLDNSAMGEIPSDVVARVLPASVFGTSYVELVPPASGGASAIRAGAVIPQDLSQPTIELQQALDSVDRLVDALGPAELASALNSLSTTLDGRGTELGRTIDRLNRYLGRLEPAFPLVREDLRLLATNLETIEAVAPDLLDAVDDGLDVAGHLVEQQAQFTALLSGGLNLVKDTDRLLTENEQDFVRVVQQSAIVTQAIYDRRVGLRSGLLAVSEATRRLQTIGEGQWLRVDGVIVDPDVPHYTRSDCPRYGSAAGSNCASAGRTAVGALVAGSLLGERRAGR